MSQDDENSKAKPGILYVNPNKKYGLIIQNKKPTETVLKKPGAPIQKPLVKPACVFDEDDDDVDEDDKQKNNLKKPNMVNVNTSENRIKKQTQIEIEKALKEDANIFEYDEIYDKLEEEKNKLDPKLKNKNESKEPKYIAGLMKAAARRQMEYEKLQDRKIQKERETEGDLWSDKEVFVTSAYRKKMEERQRLEEEEKNQEMIENLFDVRKQKDLSGFYSSMLKIRTGEMVIEEEGQKEKREREEIKFKESQQKQQKSYRTAREESSSEEEETVVKEEKVDAEHEQTDDNEMKENDKTESEQKDEFKEPLVKKPKTDETSEEKENGNMKEEKIEPVKPKLSKEEQLRLRREQIFTKRTIGEKFDSELADYFTRKSQHLSLKSYIERE